MSEFIEAVEKTFGLASGTIKGRGRQSPLPDIRACVFNCLYRSYYSQERACTIMNRDRTSAYHYKKRFDTMEYDETLSDINTIISNIYIKLS